MRKNEGKFHVAVWEREIMIEVEGYATLDNSILFRDFVKEMLENGYKNFVVDLARCSGMDSTFMGVLAGIEYAPKKNTAKVTLINASTYNQRVLDRMGISQLIPVKKGKFPHIGVPMEVIESGKRDFREKLTMIREAHQRLASLNEKNREIFRDFLETLEEEMQQQAC